MLKPSNKVGLTISHFNLKAEKLACVHNLIQVQSGLLKSLIMTSWNLGLANIHIL